MDKNNIVMKYVYLTGIVLMLFLIAEPVVAQHSLYRDVKANRVGDIITIVLVENISGSTTSDARSASSIDGSATGTVSGNFLPYEPTFGTGARVDYGSDERNLANQGQLLEGYVSVQIVEVDQMGNLVVEGSRQTEINGEVHEMNIRGLVRTNDIDNRNRVLSYKLANADIKYQKKGGLIDSVKPKKSFSRLAFRLVSVGLAAITIKKALN